VYNRVDIIALVSPKKCEERVAINNFPIRAMGWFKNKNKFELFFNFNLGSLVPRL